MAFAFVLWIGDEMNFLEFCKNFMSPVIAPVIYHVDILAIVERIIDDMSYRSHIIICGNNHADSPRMEVFSNRVEISLGGSVPSSSFSGCSFKGTKL